MFRIENYIFNPDGLQKPLFLTRERVKRIKRVHNELLLPMYHHYFGENATPSCQIRITFGLGGYADIRRLLMGSPFSKHLTGEAVDFTIVGVDNQQVIQDLKTNKLKLNFGVLYDRGVIHMTLPTKFENLEIQRMYLQNPTKDANSLEIEFI